MPSLSRHFIILEKCHFGKILFTLRGVQIVQTTRIFFNFPQFYSVLKDKGLKDVGIEPGTLSLSIDPLTN